MSQLIGQTMSLKYETIKTMSTEERTKSKKAGLRMEKSQGQKRLGGCDVQIPASTNHFSCWMHNSPAIHDERNRVENLFSAFITTVSAQQRCKSRKDCQHEYILSQQISTTSLILLYISLIMQIN